MYVAYHVNDHLPDHLPLLLGKVDKDVALWVLQYLEGDGQVMVLKNRLVIVHEGQLAARVDEILVCQSRVVHVVDGGREDGGHHLQRREHILKTKGECPGIGNMCIQST